MENYENEGFLYINNSSDKTFVKGKIRDINKNIICPGVIVPIINPIKETTRDEFGDELLISIDSYLPFITHFYQLQRCKKVRIYWNPIDKNFMISTERRIYAYNENFYFESSVNINLLDKNLCYYAYVNNYENKLILTNIVDKEQPNLLDSYDISNDSAFIYHIDKELIKFSINAETVMELINKIDSFENGVLFILDDGRQIEYRNKNYNYYCMLEKPETMSINIYFIYYLNRCADGDTFEEYFSNLHIFMYEYLNCYPEYTQAFQNMSNNLYNYVMKNCNEINVDIDKTKIELIDNLLQLNAENILQLLLE